MIQEDIEIQFRKIQEQNKHLKDEVSKLKRENKQLKEKLETLQGFISITDKLEQQHVTNALRRKGGNAVVLGTTPTEEISQGEENPPFEESYSTDEEIVKDTTSAGVTTSVAGGSPPALDVELQKDIIYGINRSLTEWKFDTRNSAYDVITPDEYSFAHQFIEHRKKEQLLKIKTFAPKVFHKIRSLFLVTDEDILNSIQLENIRSVKGEGKSGAFLMLTRDHHFIIKTATKEERDFLWNVLPYYLQYIKAHTNTLLSRILGVYSLKHEGIGGVTRFFIMNNVFDSRLYYDPVEKYDLKGSSYGRSVPPDQRPHVSTLKDNDILESDTKIWISKDLRDHLLEQLRNDTEFLASRGIMDYSMLVGIHYETEENRQELRIRKEFWKRSRTIKTPLFVNIFQQDEGGFRGYNPRKDREEYYFVGLIDLLTKYDSRKATEHRIKKWVTPSGEVSVVNPRQYCSRFNRFMSEKIITEVEIPRQRLFPRKEDRRSPRDTRKPLRTSGSGKKKEIRSEEKKLEGRDEGKGEGRSDVKDAKED